MYCGLDLSLTGTGIVILSETGGVIHAETVKNNLRGPERLVHIRKVIKDIMLDAEPLVTCIEDYAMGIRAGQSFSIGELGGVARVLLYEMQVPYNLISPTQVKKFITGKGNAEKDVIMLSVYKNFGYEAKDNNIADAFGLAMMALCIDKPEFAKMAYQKEIISLILSGEKPAKKKKSVKPTDVLLRRKRVTDPGD